MTLHNVVQQHRHKAHNHTNVLQASKPTCTMDSVAVVTGSEKSPPGGDTAPTMVTLRGPGRVAVSVHSTGSVHPTS